MGTSFSDFFGTAGNDTQTGTEGNDRFFLYGEQGTDRISTLGGADQVVFDGSFVTPPNGIVIIEDWDPENDVIVALDGLDIGVTQGRSGAFLFNDNGIFARLPGVGRDDVVIVTELIEPEPVFTLELLHIADQEANASVIDNIDNLSAVLNALRDEDLGDDEIADNTLTLSSGDAIIPGLFFDASEAVFGSAGIADIQIQNELGIEAIALGNHEFDLGTAFLADLIDGSTPGDFSALTGTDLDGLDFEGADFPYLSANLGFDTDPNLAPLEVAGGQDTDTLSQVVTSSSVSDVNGELIGIVGATVPTIDSISSAGDDLGIFPESFDSNPTDEQLDALAAILQAEVDALLADNPTMNKVILLSHMQQITIEQALAERLENVDIIVAGGSNTRLFDEDDRPRDGDSVQGEYPIFVENAGGTSTAVVNTDGTYKYVGRLVIGFDEDGNIIEETYDPTISGAYATDDQGVADLDAAGLVDPEIDAITDAIQAEIVSTESNVFGVSDVFLNGNRSGTFTADDPDGVRTQETNLGNLTADANLAYANDIIAAETLGDPVVVSIKNGGGIRANIGEIVVPAGGTEAIRLPNSPVLDENGVEVKPEGGISQNDIATTLSFNNGLTLLDITRSELVDFLEGSVAALPGVSGGFPQISGLKFSFDETQTAQTYDDDGNIEVAGERVQNAGIFDENDNLIAELVRDGELVGDPNETFRIVTLDFLADSGDEILSNLSNPNRLDLQDLDDDGVEDGVTTGVATFSDDGSEQDALAEYLAENFPDADNAFTQADTGPAQDERIQNLLFREDTVLPEPEPFTLELLHIADQEANAAVIDNIDNLSAVLNALRDEDLGEDGVLDNTLTLSSGDAIIPGLFFDASEAVFGSAGIADIQIQNELGIEAIALGNHEFDLGTEFLADLIDGSVPGDFSALTGTDLDGLDFEGADFPYLSANLGFDTDPFLAPLEVEGGQDTDTLSQVVTSSSVSDVNGELIGIVGATVPTIDSISSAGDDLGIFPASFDSTPTDAQLDELAAILQAEVDALLADNPTMNKVILLSHMQQITIEQALAERLENVDIIVAGGSNTRLFDEDDRPRDGDSVQGEYPIFVENAGGTSTAVVNTDGTYKYVGRLVIDFDEDGNIIEESYDPTVSGAYATDDQGVTDLGAEGLVDPEIDAITDAIQAEIVSTESNVFGVSDVFLNGNRSGTFTADDPDGVRTQETNLGNLTADANLAYANDIIEAGSLGDPVQISIKNGGGIRANIGEIVVPAGGTEAIRVPNSSVVDENGIEVKPEGGISQNDIGTALSFNNGLAVVDVTRAELVELLEGGVSALPSVDGGFLQISGIKFSFDETQQAQVRDGDGNITTPGERVQNAGVFDENDNLVAVLVQDGELVGDPNETFRVVTLDFLLDFGDPILATLNDLSAPNRLDLFDLDDDGVDDGATTGVATFSEDGTEQDALAEYLAENFPDADNAFNEADTGPALDERIQNLTFRADTVLPEPPTTDVVINEVLGSTTSTDAEYIELFGVAGTSLEGLSLIVVEGDDEASTGSIDFQFDFGAGDALGENGFFLLASPEAVNVYGVTPNQAISDNSIENSAYTIALVSTDSITGSSVTGAELVVDSVALADGDNGGTGGVDESLNTFFFGAPVIGPDGTFLPAGVGRIEDGVDTDAAGDWQILSFNNETPPNTPQAGLDLSPAVLDVEEVGNVLLDGGAEIVDFDPITQQAFVTSGDGVQVVDMSDPTNPVETDLLDPLTLGFDSSEVTSVAVSGNLVAASLPDSTGTDNGRILFFTADTLEFLGVVQVGPLPDSVAWNDAGTHLVVANEGESAGDENEPAADPNPEGSISIIEVNAANPTISTVTTLGFGALTDAVLRINPAAPSTAADIEPEFVKVLGNTAGITLQENNGILVIPDVTNPPAELTDANVFTAGTTDFSQGTGIDPSNEDGGIDINPEPILGLNQPDGHDLVLIDGVAYVVTANEGDGRGDDPFVDGGDIARGADLLTLENPESPGDPLLDPTIFDAAFQDRLDDDADLGRLEFSVIDGDTDGDGDIDQLHAFGGRSFSIFNVETGEEVFNSGTEIEFLTSQLVPEIFNSDESDPDEFDDRSDDGGPEPEGVVVGQVGDTIYAFVGLERVGGVMVYDITDPANATFDQYIPAQVGDGPVNAGPEGLEFIPAEDSPTGQALLVVSAEDSSTLAVYTIEDGRNFQLVSAVQGSTAAGDGDRTVGVDDVSPLEGQEVTVTAIVTADFTGDGSLGGFTIQEEDADSDGDDTTSEGIFIQAPDAMVELGDLVQVTGIVQEVDGETRIIADVVTTISSDNDLPTATVVEFPTADVLIDQDGDFVADLEAYEGMLVTIPEDLFVTELFQLDRFGTIRVSSEGRLEQFTENNTPDADGFEQHLRDVASRSLVLDDGLSTQNPDPIFIPDGDDNVLSAGEDFRMGDTLANVTGVITYSEDPTGSEEPEFRIHTPEADYTNANPRPTEAEDVGGNLKVATFNVLNFFTTLDTFPGTEGVGADGTLDPRGADTNPQNAVDGVGETDEFDRQLEKLVNAIEEIDSDIIGLSELENDFLDPGIRPVDTDAQGDRTFAIAELVEALNASAGAEVWGFADPGVENVGTDAISTGIIYRTDAVTQVGTTEFLVFTEASSAATQAVADVLNPFVDGDDQLTNLQRNRPAVAATFEDENGERVTVAVNHYKSKGDSGLEDLAEAAQEALDGGEMGFTQADIDALLADPNYDQNDGAAFWNAVRTDASNELVAWLDTDPTGGGTDNILVVGDLNSYKEEDPVTALEDAGYGNLAEIFEADDTGSFVFDGQLGTLDYIFANEDVLGDVTGATIYDINSPEPDVFDFNLEFGRDPALFSDDTSFRSSDHDPVIAGLDLTGAGIVADFVGTSANDTVTGTEGNDTFSQFGAQGMDRITTLDGMDQIIFGPEINAPGRGMVTVVDFDAANDIIVQSGIDIGVTQGRGDVLLFSDAGIFARLVDTDRADVQIIDDMMI